MFKFNIVHQILKDIRYNKYRYPFEMIHQRSVNEYFLVFKPLDNIKTTMLIQYKFVEDLDYIIKSINTNNPKINNLYQLYRNIKRNATNDTDIRDNINLRLLVEEYFWESLYIYDIERFEQLKLLEN